MFCLRSAIEIEWFPYFIIISMLILAIITFGIGYLCGQEKKK